MPSPQSTYPSYLALSIFNLLCCCFPLGIAAVIYSCQVDNANSLGNVNLAAKASRTARLLNIVGIVLGVILIIVLVVIYVVALKEIQ
ncbi:synapse differentiation-inducing gene protein 1-like [Anolis carolinensis]|uniref:synapse differentiation-inducing gene protein 1-like n=1 Tax=Anolis carolinensis TaxID=28377 RepID=UPI000203AF2F|nr:PREDICTED: synapse differentiation-inducing gene protein 1-like [Anolis carolinensis]|eukprot:XP_003228829.1 PREDICTED: synapse differentiation-inducing gene protein 1-like [Anolis carolinensis]